MVNVAVAGSLVAYRLAGLASIETRAARPCRHPI
jgi:hypothetical protein